MVCRTCRNDPCLTLSAHNENAAAQPETADMLTVTVGVFYVHPDGNSILPVCNKPCNLLAVQRV